MKRKPRLSLNKKIIILFGAGIIVSLFSSFSQVEAKVGCDCTALWACFSTDCDPWCGFCADDDGRKCSVCLCKTGGMAHCSESDWKSIFADKHCHKLRDYYCNNTSGPDKCNNDPVCN